MVRISIKGAVFMLAMVATGLCGFAFISLFTPLVFIARMLDSKCESSPSKKLLRVFHLVADTVVAVWQANVGLFLRDWLGMEVTQTAVLPTPSGKAAPPEEDISLRAPENTKDDKCKVSLICVNHPSRVDWLLLWAFFTSQYGILFGLKIILKASLRSAPIFGWVLQYTRYIFFARSAEEDKANTARIAKYYHRHGERATVFIFPEGSDLSESNVEKSQAFAKKNGLPQFQRVLNPRWQGVNMVLESFGDAVDEVIEMTVAYDEHERGHRPSEADLLGGTLPKGLHVWFKRYELLRGTSTAVSTARSKTHFPLVLSSSEAVKAWIDDTFLRKENLLVNFYKRGHTMKTNTGALANSFCTTDEADEVRKALRLLPETWVTSSSNPGALKVAHDGKNVVRPANRMKSWLWYFIMPLALTAFSTLYLNLLIVGTWYAWLLTFGTLAWGFFMTKTLGGFDRGVMFATCV